jgi:hypothetical protein
MLTLRAYVLSSKLRPTVVTVVTRSNADGLLHTFRHSARSRLLLTAF